VNSCEVDEDSSDSEDTVIGGRAASEQL